VVYVLQDGKPSAVNIKTGLTDNKQSEVLSGPLKVGDKLITEDKVASKKDKAKQSQRLF
jgi:HlyD family secretion protein